MKAPPIILTVVACALFAYGALLRYFYNTPEDMADSAASYGLDVAGLFVIVGVFALVFIGLGALSVHFLLWLRSR